MWLGNDLLGNDLHRKEGEDEMYINTRKEVTEFLSRHYKEDEVIAIAVVTDYETQALQAEESYHEHNFTKKDYTVEMFKEVMQKFNYDSSWDYLYEAFNELESDYISTEISESKKRNADEVEEEELWDKETQDDIHSKGVN